MSVFQFISRAAQNHAQQITSNVATTVFDATGNNESFFVPWFMVNENAGATPNLTVDLWDGTTSYPLADSVTRAVWVTKAVTARQSVLFNEGYVIAKGWVLRVTSSDVAGKFNVIGVQGGGN